MKNTKEPKEKNMGWSNYIIVEDWKMIIETSREVGELEDYIKKSLGKMTSDENDLDVSISDLKVSEMTIKDLCALASAYENASSIASMDTDKLFLYWLEGKEIEYQIKSEFNLDLKKYKEDGYKIIRRWKSDEHNGDDNNQEISRGE
jgi:hypothetical protein